jgi:endonuclease G, mitochondrial
MFSFKQLLGGCVVAACIYFGYKYFTHGRDAFTDAELWITEVLKATEQPENPKNPDDVITDDDTKVIVKDDKKKKTDDVKPSKTGDYLPESKGGEIVEHQYFTLSYSEKHEQPEWVAYELSKTMFGQEKFDRKDNFRPDPDVSTESALPADYRGSGYDRGHLCPAADMSFDENALDETFFMSNMSPQNPSLNHGIWRELEENTRDWAKKFKHLYIVTGPILRNTRGFIGKKNKVSIPTSYYKILLDLSKNEPKAIAYIIPNELRTETLDEFACSIDKVEKQTGINFFPKLMSATQEASIESSFDIQKWRWNPNRYQLRLEKWNKEVRD